MQNTRFLQLHAASLASPAMIVPAQVQRAVHH